MDRVEIKNLNICATYTLNTGEGIDDKCLLCKLSLTAPPLQDLQNGSLTVTVLAGNCDHYFHKSCLELHNKDDKIIGSTCPTDNLPWKTKREITFRNAI